MIQYLSGTLDEFPGPANQTRCFVHTINLIAKSILKPFDIRKMKNIREFNDVAHALADSAEGRDPDECAEQATGNDGEEDKEEEEEGEDDDTSLGPIRSMLLKVCLRFIDTLNLADEYRSYGKFRSHSRTRRPSSCLAGTRRFPLTVFPCV